MHRRVGMRCSRGTEKAENRRVCAHLSSQKVHGVCKGMPESSSLWIALTAPSDNIGVFNRSAEVPSFAPHSAAAMFETTVQAALRQKSCDDRHRRRRWLRRQPMTFVDRRKKKADIAADTMEYGTSPRRLNRALNMKLHCASGLKNVRFLHLYRMQSPLMKLHNFREAITNTQLRGSLLCGLMKNLCNIIFNWST